MFTKNQVLQIIDSCFHCYASDYRPEAKKMAEETMERIAIANKQVHTADTCCNSPDVEKCDQCQETGIANPLNH